MRGRERVVDPEVAELGECGDEVGIVLLFALMEARILQTKNIARLHRADRSLRLVADAILGEGDWTADDLRGRCRDRSQRLLGVRSLWAAEMREQDDLAAFVGDFGDGRLDALDAGRVRHRAVFHRHVEINAQQDALVLDVGVVEGTESRHGRLNSLNL